MKAVQLPRVLHKILTKKGHVMASKDMHHWQRIPILYSWRVSTNYFLVNKVNMDNPIPHERGLVMAWCLKWKVGSDERRKAAINLIVMLKEIMEIISYFLTAFRSVSSSSGLHRLIFLRLVYLVASCGCKGETFNRFGLRRCIALDWLCDFSKRGSIDSSPHYIYITPQNKNQEKLF